VSYCEFFYTKVPESAPLVKIRGCPMDREEPAAQKSSMRLSLAGERIDGKGFGMPAKCGEAPAAIG
jgi:hypothetical protein